MKEMGDLRKHDPACDGLSILDQLESWLDQSWVELCKAHEKGKKKKYLQAKGSYQALLHTVALVKNPYNPDVIKVGMEVAQRTGR